MTLTWLVTVMEIARVVVMGILKIKAMTILLHKFDENEMITVNEMAVPIIITVMVCLLIYYSNIDNP